MSGIAGIVDLAGGRAVPAGVIQAMAAALAHRGPDEESFFELPGLALASRRLAVVAPQDGRQPLTNEDGTVTLVGDGQQYDYRERRAELEGRGHRFSTNSDAEFIPHLWEDVGPATFERLRGQFALALHDRGRNELLLARDRFGVCPLYWTRQGDWLLFASEIKALLASGLVPARPDVRGLDNVFNFFALPAPLTCFQGVELLMPGRYLRVALPRPGEAARLGQHSYWEVDFPNQGQEENPSDEKKLAAEFEAVLATAVERQLRADVPVVTFFSGGIDSTTVAALASKVLGKPIPTFTVRIPSPGLDETSEVNIAARHIGLHPISVDCGDQALMHNYPRLIRAAEGPVVDTSCTALLLLAEVMHAHGYKAALTGEVADEWLAGHPWFRVHGLLNRLDFFPGVPLSQLARRAYLRRILGGTREDWAYALLMQQAAGGRNAFLEVYSLMGLSRRRFFSPAMWEQLGDYDPYATLEPDRDRLSRWDPLHRSVYWGARIHVAGHLLSLKGDRVAMHSSVQTRYPFLDHDVFNFLAKLHPRWKLRGRTGKYLLRLLAERWLPAEIAWRPKKLFRAPMHSFFTDPMPAYVDQLLSPESLRKTGYFDPSAVVHWRQRLRELRPGGLQRTSVEMGLVGVLATQLWHHTFLDASLAELPAYRPERVAGVS